MGAQISDMQSRELTPADLELMQLLESQTPEDAAEQNHTMPGLAAGRMTQRHSITENAALLSQDHLFALSLDELMAHSLDSQPEASEAVVAQNRAAPPLGALHRRPTTDGRWRRTADGLWRTADTATLDTVATARLPIPDSAAWVGEA